MIERGRRVPMHFDHRRIATGGQSGGDRNRGMSAPPCRGELNLLRHSTRREEIRFLPAEGAEVLQQSEPCGPGQFKEVIGVDVNPDFIT